MVRHARLLAAAMIAAGLSFEMGASSQEDRGAGAAPAARFDEILGLSSAAGAFVVSIDPGSPAELAGLDVCDLIAGFDGRDFRDYGALSRFADALREAAAVSAADLEIWRVSDALEVVHKDDLRLLVPSRKGSRLGAGVTLQILILAVRRDGPADAGGVRAGEFIDQVNGQKVSAMPSVNKVDQMIVDAAQRDGKVSLTLAQWKPVRGSAQFKTTYRTRDVVVEVGSR